MLDITNHLGSTNQDHMRCHFIPVRMATNKRQKTSTGEDVDKKEHLHTVGGNVVRTNI
jgi:hypothetical protein